MRVLLPALAALAAAAALQSDVAGAATATNVAITAKPAAVTRATTAAFAWKRTGKITSTRCRLGRNRWRACRTSISYRSLKPGVHTFTVQVRGTRTVTRTATWRVDVTVPTAPSVSGGSDAWFAGVRTIAATGSTDAGGAGMAGYQFHVSTDGGTTWSAPAVQNPVMVSAPGVRLVQFRAVDKAGNVSAWAPVSPDTSGTVKIDQTAPGTPVLSGGSPLWQNVVSVDVTVGPLSDAGGSGLAADPLTVETSTNGGSTWSAEAPAASTTVSDEGDTLVRFRSHDAAGNVSLWAQAEVRIDRTAPSDPSLAGGSASWFDSASMLVSASGATDTPGSGIDHYEYETSTDGGSTWSSATSGATASITAEGETVLRFRAIDGAGLTSGWVQGTVRLDRTAPSAPSVSGLMPGWQSVASVTATASGSTDGLSGLDHYEYEISADGGTTWGVATAGDTTDVTDEGRTSLRFRAVDAAGNASAWMSGDAWLDRTAPSDPSLAGGSSAWLSQASESVTASGSADASSGLDRYESETSTDGGSTWSAPTAGSLLAVSAEGETLVRFRAVDAAGLASAWVGATVRLDRTAPTAPGISGSSSAWQNVASVALAASGSTDAGGSGLDHVEHESSTDGGATWSSPTTGASVLVSTEGATRVRFRSVDGAGNTSAWAQGTARIDRSAPSDPTLAGGSLAWSSAASSTITASGSADAGSGIAGYEYQTSTDGGSTWSGSTAGAGATVSAQGQTLVRFRAVDNAGLTSNWVQATVRLDHTAPTAPTVSGGSSAWQNVASLSLSASGSTDAGGASLSGYEYETSTDGGTTWSAPQSGSSTSVSAEGQTLVRFRAVDGAGNSSSWVQGTAKLDRSAPSDPTVSGGSSAWQSVVSLTATASASTDAGSGLTGYEYRTSTDGGTTWSSITSGTSKSATAEGQTLVQFRAIDGVGLRSNWVQATLRIDRTLPTAPTVTGGSTSWRALASVSISASGSTDAGGSSLAGYQYRTSANGGTTWSAATAGTSAAVTAEGTTIVQLRSIDGAGNVSAWVPASAGASNTVKLDRTGPTAPAVTGNNLSWLTSTSVTVTPSGSTDTGGSGFNHYEVRTSTNGGTTWSSTASATSKAITSQGETLVQFRAVDNVGNASGWTQATVRLDRTAPAVPTVAGGSLSWQNLASVTVSATGGSDTMSGLTGYQYRTNAGSGWSGTATGASVAVTAQGTTQVQFRTIDAVGNVSAWTPSSSGATNTVKLDRTAPTTPTVSGGSLTCSKTKRTITGKSSSDSSSGVNHYEYRVSTNGGTTWGATVSASSVTPSVAGSYVVQFRAVDNVGLASAWAPTTNGAANSACLT
ncbi:MAG: beta strand repeat-containing protein [Gaiellales bacterium]